MDSKEKEFDSLVVSRHEIKYFINPIKCMQLSGALKNVMLEDKHNGPDGYSIRSLYFDTYAETDFYEKLAGIENRKKIRLRVYSPDDKLVKLEIKRKFGDEQVKKSAFISKEDAVRLIACDYDVLRDYEDETARMIYEIMRVNHVRPVVLIEYQRKAFIHPTNNIRVTVDTNIRSNETYFGLFDALPALCPTEEFIFALLEVKYDSFIMHWLSELLSQYDLTRGAYSKYFVSRGIFERYLT